MKILSIAFGTLLSILFTTQFSFSQSSPSVSPADTVKNLTFKVKGITCSNDLKSITANVEKLNHVANCKPGKQGPTTTFHIQYNPLWVSEKEIITAIESTPGCDSPESRLYKVRQ